MLVNANASFTGAATFSQALQLYSNSSSAANGVVLGFQRQNGGSAVSSGFTLGSILFTAYDGSVQGPTAQIRSVMTVSLPCCEFCSHLACIGPCLMHSSCQLVLFHHKAAKL